jgi:predicted nucleic acid-binding protein
VLFLLDTNVISGLMKMDQALSAWVASLGADDRLVTCKIARGEILFGIRRLPEGRRRSELENKAQRVLASLRCEAVPPAAADSYAAVKVVQRTRGLCLDENDLWIAATALALTATLVSRDADFARVDELPVLTI